MLITISQAADLLGVNVKTLYRWGEDGKIPVHLTPGGYRRYKLADLYGLGFRPPSCASGSTIAYASAPDGHPDNLERQVTFLESYCTFNGWTFEVIKDLGSGMDSRKPGLVCLIGLICSGDIGRLVICHKDRLLRFGSELIFTLCEQFKVEIVIINAFEDLLFDEELARDVMDIITIFSARLYDGRGRKNRDFMDRLREAADEL